MNKNRDIASQKWVEEWVAKLIEMHPAANGRRVILPSDEYSPYDFRITDKHGATTSLIEFRERPDLPKGRYKTIMINVAKIDKIMAQAATMGVKAGLLVKWQEPDLWITELTPEKYTTEIIRRRDPKPTDKPERGYMIPNSSFKHWMGYW